MRKGADRVRFIFRNYLLRWTGFMEVFLSFLLILSVVIAAAGLVLNLYGLTQKLNDTGYFQKFLGSTMALIIALELIKMILRDTISSTIEVLLIAISRKLIVSEGNTLDFLIGIIAIAFLFLIRKYLFVSEFSTDSGLWSAQRCRWRKRKSCSGGFFPVTPILLAGWWRKLRGRKTGNSRKGRCIR